MGSAERDRMFGDHVNKYQIQLLQKKSFAWKYFGNLVYTNDGKRKILEPDKLFCKQCLADAQKQAEDLYEQQAIFLRYSVFYH